MRIELPSGTPAELAEPERTPTLGMVVAPDIGGLRPLFDDLCARLAAEHGWVVCAPEPWPGREDMALPERLESVASLTDERTLGDLVAAADATGQERVGILGFCMGGMFTLKAAGTGRFVGAAPFYGMIRVPEQWRSDALGEPLEAVRADGACPVLGIFGTADPWTPEADLDALEATGAEVIRYPGADHGFVHDPDRPAHRPEFAADAWRRVTTFFTTL